MNPYELGAYWTQRLEGMKDTWNSADEETRARWAAELKLKRYCNCGNSFRVEHADSNEKRCQCCKSDYEAELKKLATKQVDLDEAIEAERQRRKAKP